ncbi:MAG: hypothetical protein ACTH6F_14170, partial [Halomonas sp.]
HRRRQGDDAACDHPFIPHLQNYETKPNMDIQTRRRTTLLRIMATARLGLQRVNGTQAIRACTAQTAVSL